MDWVLHIGYQKTGSKALQTFLGRQPERRPGVSLCFPGTGREGLWHRPIHEELKLGGSSLLAGAVAEAEASGCELAVLSFEGLCMLPRTAIERVRKLVGPARVVMFLRRQDELANSILNQMVMAHRCDFEWIEWYENKITEYDPDLDFRLMLSHWSDCFGRANVIPLRYDKRADAAVRFGDAIGMQVLPPPPGQGNPNPALDLEGFRILRELKRDVPEEQVPALVDKALADLAPHFVDTVRSEGASLLDAARRDAIYRNYAESNEWVRQQWFPDSPSLFPPADAPT